MNQLRSILVDDETIVASQVKTVDLPINPLSAVILTLKGENADATETTLAEMLERLTKITISRLGETIIDISGKDLYALNCVMFGHEPIQTNKVATDAARITLTLILPLGRKMYDPEECYPGTRKGEFKLQITFSATETGMDNVTLLVETIELMGASPRRHLKVTTGTDSSTASKEDNFDLPIGNQLAGILLFSTTVPTGILWTTTLDWVKVMKNNVEHQIASTKWEALHGELLRRIGFIGDHSAAFGDDLIHQYAFIDFYPLGDDRFLVESKGASSFRLRFYAGDTNEWRILPLELISV